MKEERTYPYYGKMQPRWGRIGETRHQPIIRFTAPDTGVVVDGTFRYPTGKFSKRWSEKNFDKVDYTEN